MNTANSIQTVMGPIAYLTIEIILAIVMNYLYLKIVIQYPIRDNKYLNSIDIIMFTGKKFH